MDPLKVAVVQSGSLLFDTAATLDRAVVQIGQAAAQGARLVVFPEVYLGGYPKGMDFGARVGMRSDEGRTMFRRYFDGAVEVPGPEVLRLSAAAADYGVHLVMGALERDGGTLYCCVLFFGPDGRLLGKRRKLMPTAMERLIWGQGDGSTLPVFDTAAGRIGAVICWENYMPLLRATMYAKGIQIYCAPTVDDRDSWIPAMQMIAQEGRCFVISACQFAQRTCFPQDTAPGQGNPRDAVIRGGSVIVNPLGQILAGPWYNSECILTADLDLGQIAEGKFDLDVAGHYARPDVFRLLVNDQEQTPAEFGVFEAIAGR